jgi:hypothetical protein
MTRIYVPCDAGALAMGADAVARAIERQIVERRIDAVVVRNGSRGMFWLEPLVEIETPRDESPMVLYRRERSMACSTPDFWMATSMTCTSA